METIDRPGDAPSSALDAIRNFAPFAGALALAWITVPIASSIDWTQYVIATALLLVAASMRLLLVGRTEGGLRWILPSLVVLSGSESNGNAIFDRSENVLSFSGES